MILVTKRNGTVLKISRKVNLRKWVLAKTICTRNEQGPYFERQFPFFSVHVGNLSVYEWF